MLRKKRGFSLGQVAKYLEVEESYIAKCESNESEFTVHILEKVSELFGCSDAFFFNEQCDYKLITTTVEVEELETQDLRAIAALNKIAINLRLIIVCLSIIVFILSTSKSKYIYLEILLK